MNRSRPLYRIASIAATLAASGAAPAASADASDVVIMMTDHFRFEPETVTIRSGESIEWRNASHFAHILTDDPVNGDAAIPAGAEGFSSGEIPPGEAYRRSFSVTGTYRYFCIPHEGIGMVGQITVLPK